MLATRSNECYGLYWAPAGAHALKFFELSLRVQAYLEELVHEEVVVEE